MQLNDVRDFVARSKWEPVEYLEKESTRKRRPELERLIADARLRKLDVVVVWKLDRFGRSTRELLDNIETLDRAGVRFVCLSQGIDTDKKSITGRLVVNILAAVAEFERDLINERVNEGVKEYRRAFDAGEVGRTRHSRSKKDLPPHRPAKIFRRDRAVELRDQGMSWRRIAAELGVDQRTIRRVYAAAKGVAKVEFHRPKR